MFSRRSVVTVLVAGSLVLSAVLDAPSSGWAAEVLVIAASPATVTPLEAVGRAFEAAHPDVTVRLVVHPGGELRRAIATIENSPTALLSGGPVHLLAPGGEELLTRVESKSYIVSASRFVYATVPLVLVVPEALVEAPTSFAALAGDTSIRVAVADPHRTPLGQQTRDYLASENLLPQLAERLDIAADAAGALDHLRNGQADVGIVFGPDAVGARDHVRIVATTDVQATRPVAYAIAMTRLNPDRVLAQSFLTFLRGPAARQALTALGYQIPE